MSQLAKLSTPFPDAYVEKAPQGKYGSFVAHHVINQALLATVGPFDLECVQILRSYVPPRLDKNTGEVKKEALGNAVTGAVVRLTCVVDGRTVRVEEAGDCEDPHNWNTDGARLKDCMSDGLKRCAMRLGCGIHLWAQEHFFLHESLTKAERTTPQPQTSEKASSSAPQTSPVLAADGQDSRPIDSPDRPSRHKSLKERQHGHIEVLGQQLGMNHDSIRELAKTQGLLPDSGSMADMSNVERAKLLAVLTEMQAEAASA